MLDQKDLQAIAELLKPINERLDKLDQGQNELRADVAMLKENVNTLQEDVEIIKLEGSVELGPVTGISDAIVDLVETGSTLKANGLEVIEKVSDISTRMIVNKVAFKFKKDEIMNIVNQLEKVIGGN